MKNYLFFPLTLFLSSLTYSQEITVLFEDSFEEYEDFAIADVGEWTLIDVDGTNTYSFGNISYPHAFEEKAFQVFDGSKTTPPLQGQAADNWKARTGSKGMVTFAPVGALNNDWLISPKIALGESDNVLKFYAKSTDPQYPFEEFNVLISTTGTAIENFTEIGNEIIDRGGIYNEYSYDLSAYNGQEIHFAVQCVSDDQFGFMVDDFTVSGNKLGISEINLKEVTRIYPNPVKTSFELQLSPTIHKDKLNVDVFDLTGRKIITFGSHVEKYNIETLPKGTYIIKINDGTTRIIKKLIKK